MTTRRVSPTGARWVKVPPTSIPIRHIFIRRGRRTGAPPARRPPPIPPPESDCAGKAGARAARDIFSAYGAHEPRPLRPPRPGRPPRDASVEPRAIAGLQPAREVLDAHARDGDLVVEHLGGRRQAREIGPARRLPESRALEGLGAMQEDLLDLDADGEAGNLAV